jgi:two-component system cell cycle response regulator DivK
MPDPQSTAERRPGRGCILIVDDDALNLKLFGSLLAARGYRVLLAMDAARALNLAHDERPDVVIMDVQLPGMSGLDATRRLKSDTATRGIPVIIATAFLVDKDEILASGCDAYMPKPFATSTLMSTIEAFIARSAEAAG